MPPTLKGRLPVGLIERWMSRGLVPGATYEIVVSGGGRKNVEQKVRRQSVGDVWRKVEMLYGPLPVSSFGGNLADGRVDQNVDWLWKRGSMLGMMVPHQPKGATLREHCIVLVHGAVPKAKDKLGGDHIPANSLCNLARGDRCAVHGLKSEEAVCRALSIANVNRVRMGQDGTGERQSKESPQEAKE